MDGNDEYDFGFSDEKESKKQGELNEKSIMDDIMADDDPFLDDDNFLEEEKTQNEIQNEIQKPKENDLFTTDREVEPLQLPNLKEKELEKEKNQYEKKQEPNENKDNSLSLPDGLHSVANVQKKVASESSSNSSSNSEIKAGSTLSTNSDSTPIVSSTNKTNIDVAKADKKPSRHSKYFVMKSFNYRDVEVSKEKGIWATQPHNEIRLNEAFREFDVYLVFSVNESRHFQGYGKMKSLAGTENAALWTRDDGLPDKKWGGVFRVEWINSYDLPFQETLHLRNPLNHNKPIKISRDGQELTPDVGRQLCELIDIGAANVAGLKRKSSSRNDDNEPDKKRARREESENTSMVIPTTATSTSSPSSAKDVRGPLSRSLSRSNSNDFENNSHRSNSDRDSPRDRYNARPRYSSTVQRQQPFDLLNMTYEDYLAARDKYRVGTYQYPTAWPQSYPQFSEVDYINYFAWLAKQSPVYMPNFAYNSKPQGYNNGRDNSRSNSDKRRSSPPRSPHSHHHSNSRSLSRR